MTNPKRCRAALYARYSTDKQSERSIDDQFHVCEDVTKRHGFTVVDRFEDAACSGGTTRRPGYQRMLDAARRGGSTLSWQKTSRVCGVSWPSRRRGLRSYVTSACRLSRRTSIPAKRVPISSAPSTARCPSITGKRSAAARAVDLQGVPEQERRPEGRPTATSRPGIPGPGGWRFIPSTRRWFGASMRTTPAG